jgi:hypothetical protein
MLSEHYRLRTAIWLGTKTLKIIFAPALSEGIIVEKISKTSEWNSIF